MTEPLVTIATFLDPLASSLARVRLEADGIACHLANEHSAAIHAGIGGVALQVRASDAERAAAILREAAAGAASYTDPEDGPRCPECATRYAIFERDGWSVILSLLTFGRVAARTHARCRKCGHVWVPGPETAESGPYRA